MGRRNGERVAIALDSKGKVSLVEHRSSVPQQAAMGFAVDDTPTVSEMTRSAEIAD